MQRNKNFNENMNNRDFCDIVMPIGINDAYCDNTSENVKSRWSLTVTWSLRGV